MKKKTIIKTGLLILAIAGAISAILLLKNSIEVPTIAFKDGLYGAMLSKELEPSTNLSTLKDIDDYCRVQSDLLLACEQEQVLSSKEQDDATLELLGHMFPSYPDACDRKFNSSWGATEVSLILHIDTMLKSLPLSNGSSAYRSNTNYSTPIARVGGYAREYRHSIFELTTNCRYPGSIDRAKQKLADIKKYGDSPYCNCAEIRSRLNTYSSRMGQSHYAYVSSILDKGCDYLHQADVAIQELDRNKSLYKGYTPDMDALESRLNEIDERCNSNNNRIFIGGE